MKTITLRNLPPELERRVEERARELGLSLDKTVGGSWRSTSSRRPGRSALGATGTSTTSPEAGAPRRRTSSTAACRGAADRLLALELTRLLVDTSVYSAFLRGHEGVVHDVARADELALTPDVLGELLARFRKGTRFEKNLERLREFTESPRLRWLVLDDETADRYAIIHDELRRAGAPIPANDLWITASAMQHGLRLLTTDPHFRRVPQIAVSLYPT